MHVLHTQRELLSRRGLLKSAGLAALLAPILRAGQAFGNGGVVAPRRVIFVFSPNGPMVATGPVTGTTSAFTFHDWWKPLQRHQADGIFISNLSATGAGIVPGPTAGSLAGGHGLGAQVFCGNGTAPDIYVSDGESVDQTIAKRLESQGKAGLVRSVAWGLQTSDWCDGFWSSSGHSIVPELSPTNAWATLFKNFAGPMASPAAQHAAMVALARRKSVLDFVNQDCAALKSALGVEGTRMLDDHCTTLRSMESNLTLMTPSTGDCKAPVQATDRDWADPENIDPQMAAFSDLISMTLACEMTNVVTFQLGAMAARNHLATSYNVPSSPLADSGDSGPAHHPWTHQDLSDPTAHTALGIFQTFYSNQVAMLVDKLKTTIDASGKPLLDSTVVVWLSELGGAEGNGDGHMCGGSPVVILGNGQGTFKTGRYLKGPSVLGGAGYVAGGQMMSQMLVSMAQYMGLSDMMTLGRTGVSGPLMSLYG